MTIEQDAEIEQESPHTQDAETENNLAENQSTAEKTKRPRGRPKGTGPGFISELPAPPRKMMWKPGEFFKYLQSIPKDKLPRVTLGVYRYMPVIDATEGGKKSKAIDIILGENHPFIDDNWENVMLHRYGCGNYGMYLNEEGREVCQCKKIDTMWDPESYPPVLDPKWLLEHASNGAYIQYLRSKGTNIPSQFDREQEREDMQVADTISKLTDTVIAQANRINTPVPQQMMRESAAERLTLDASKAVIDMVTEQAKQTNSARAKESDPIEFANALVNVADRMRGGGGGDDTLKLMLQASMQRAEKAEERSTEIMLKMMELSNKPRESESDGIGKTLALLSQMKEFMNDGKASRGDGDDEENPHAKPASIGAMLVQNLPQLMQVGLGLYGQFNQSLAMMTRMKELEASRANGTPVAAPAPVVQQAMQQAAQQPNPADTPASPPVNPATGQPFTQDEIDAARAAAIKYSPYHSLLSSIAGPMINHMNDPAKDGYDFGSWFVEGNGRLLYDQIRSVGEEELVNAIKSYTPLWQTIGGAEEKVREFVHEFMTLDEMPAESESGEGE